MVDNTGPATLEHAKKIKSRLESRIEELGHKLGIPEDRQLLLAIAKIEEIERLEEKMMKFQSEMECWHRQEEEFKNHQFNWRKFFKKGLAYLLGILNDND